MISISNDCIFDIILMLIIVVKGGVAHFTIRALRIYDISRADTKKVYLGLS